MTDDKLINLTNQYKDVCARLNSLHDFAYQGNTDVKTAYEQCRPALQDNKETLDRYLHRLESPDNEDDESYLYRCVDQSLRNLNELVDTAEDKVRNIHSIPPFLF